MKKISVLCIISKSHSEFLIFYFKFSNTSFVGKFVQKTERSAVKTLVIYTGESKGNN